MTVSLNFIRSLNGRDITPAIATQLLENNTKNRILKLSKVAKYSKDMKNGDWDVSLPEGRTLVFDENGLVLSAQHTLSAVIESGFTLPNVIIQVVSRESWLKHTAEKRDMHDRLVMANPDVDERKLKIAGTISGQYAAANSALADEDDEVLFKSTSTSPSEKLTAKVLKNQGTFIDTLIGVQKRAFDRKIVAIALLVACGRITETVAKTLVEDDEKVFSELSTKGGVPALMGAYIKYLETGKSTNIEELIGADKTITVKLK